MKEEMEYVHHPLEQAVHNLACLATPITRMKGLVDNLYKDAEEQIGALMKEHKALEIIKAKNVNIGLLRHCGSLASYHYRMDERRDECKPLTQEEFDFLVEELL